MNLRIKDNKGVPGGDAFVVVKIKNAGGIKPSGVG
jgi:hypothetical protein